MNIVAIASIIVSLSLSSMHDVRPFFGSAAQSGAVVQMINVSGALEQTLDASRAHEGDPVSLVLLDSAKLNDGTEVRKGMHLDGHIDSIALPINKKGDSSVVVTLDQLRNDSGQVVSVKTTLVSVRVSTTERINPLESSADGPGYARAPSAPGLPQAPQGMSAISPGTKYSLMPGVVVAGSLTDRKSGTLTIKRKVLLVPKGAHIEVSMAVMPPGGVLAKD